MNKETVKITKEFTYDNVGNLTKEVIYEERKNMKIKQEAKNNEN